MLDGGALAGRDGPEQLASANAASAPTAARFFEFEIM
jgi:hypothetical protein